VGGEQVLSDVLHLLGEQRCAVDLQHPQDALHLVQILSALFEEGCVVGLLYVALERATCGRERRVDLATNELECLGSDVRHVVLSRAER
jgi:hypothetical protein